MMLEAMRRKWEVYTLDTTDLFADKEGVYAHASPTTVADNPEHWFEKQPRTTVRFS
jgi:glutathione synthase/RimK-type ligase-like ATP-grasp enzyme